jgi:hypothetical protein
VNKANIIVLDIATAAVASAFMPVAAAVGFAAVLTYPLYVRSCPASSLPRHRRGDQQAHDRRFLFVRKLLPPPIPAVGCNQKPKQIHEQVRSDHRWQR